MKTDHAQNEENDVKLVILTLDSDPNKPKPKSIRHKQLDAFYHDVSDEDSNEESSEYDSATSGEEDDDDDDDDDDYEEEGRSTRVVRSASFRQRTVPLNPLAAQDKSFSHRVRAVAGLVESCWPAFLAASSTFLNAALDDQLFRNLIKAFQRFAQVAGLLRLSTPRDALMTTLAKASVPPHIVNAMSATLDSARSPPLGGPEWGLPGQRLLAGPGVRSRSGFLAPPPIRRRHGHPSVRSPSGRWRDQCRYPGMGPGPHAAARTRERSVPGAAARFLYPYLRPRAGRWLRPIRHGRGFGVARPGGRT